ncbi:hypothetical protein ASC97_05580 [Rhizobium sp. Root1203]|uniref:hypothetical protein n=1 Tax=Rhizobium sp. Root1203 TaxID=1736427 RepID=UPI000713C970|nr:hypothetical protein [Rhizobium sp. Root1203]KQV27837.1 hypothetical protein ASC97_05580 [Rhizobium sp. Root1203]
MTLIQCKLGPVQPVVGDHQYQFTADGHGRYVAEVHNLIHQRVFLSVEHYIVAPEVAEEPPPVEDDGDVTDLPPILTAPRLAANTDSGQQVRRRGKRRS